MKLNSTIRLGALAAVTAVCTLTYAAASGQHDVAGSNASTLAEGDKYLGPGYLDCDGTRYMTIPHAEEFDIEAGGQMTISARVWLDSYGTHRGIISNRFHSATSSSTGNGSTTGYDIYGGYSAANSMSNNVNMNKGSWNNIGHVWCNTLGTETWQTVTWVFDGQNGVSKIYLDGELKDTRSGNDLKNYAINPQGDILVGSRYNLNAYPCAVDASLNWLGKIADVRFYSTAMSAEEVALLHEVTVGPETENLIAAYDFKDINGYTVTDISGHGHNGTLVGFPEYVLGSVITINQPQYGEGTVTVKNGDEAIVTGQRVEDGTTLTVEATPAEGYLLSAIMVNDAAIEGESFVVDGETTVSATFERDPSAPSKVLVFDMGEDGSRYYRIPALVTAADGSLVALADKRGDALGDLPNTISIVAKRSTDGGKTWSDAVTIAQGNAAEGKTYGDPAVVLDRNTGKLVAVFAGDTGFFVSTPTNRAGFYVSTSSDNGITWTEPRAITDQVYQSNWYGAFCASGSMLQTADGKIMFVSNTRLSSKQYVADVYEFVCCSEDGGETWSVINNDSRIPAAGNGNESKLVETSDGTLIMSIRSSGLRRFSKSTDGGKTWSPAETVKDLIEPDCNGDIIVYPSTDGQTRMLHSLPANASTRRDVAIYLSYDEGKTWPVKKQLLDTYSAYSSLTVLPDGTIGCLVEEGKWDSNIPGEDGFRIYYMNFTLDWLTDGADAPVVDPNEVFDGTLNCDGTRYMTIPHAEEFDIEAGGQMTISAKVRLAEYGEHRGIISNRFHSATSSSTGNGSTTGYDIYGGYSAANSMSNNVNMNKGSWNNIGHVWCNTLGSETWQTVTWVFDGQNGVSKIYLDGELKDTRTGNDLKNYAINPQADILVGARYNLNLYPCDVNPSTNWIGNIDDVRFYSKALTEEEVIADINATVNSETPDLIAAYDFAEIKGQTVTDISGNGHDGQLVGFPSSPVYYNVTISECEHGTLAVFNGDTEVMSGRKIDGGTELTVVATPAGGYMVENVTVNGTPLEGDTFVLEEDAVVAASFVRDPSQPVSYVEPSGDGASDTNCYVETASTTGAVADINITRSAKNGENYELCDDQIIEVCPGLTFSLRLQAKRTNESTASAPTPQDLRYCVAYIFSDWNCDGEFENEVPTNDLFSAKKYYGYWKNDAGFPGNIAANFDHTLDITHTFEVPADAPYGDSRIRVIYTEAWDNNVANDAVTGNYQAINKGYAYDYLVKCGEKTSINEIDADNAEAELFSIQGIRVAGKPAPGIYLKRQGNKTVKVIVAE